MIFLATSFTPEYKYANLYIKTLNMYCNIPFTALEIGKDINSCGMPNNILQAGHFLDHIPKEAKTIIFTDADFLMHRPFDQDELTFLKELKEGEISACPNMHPDQMYAEEANVLSPRKLLEGFDDVRVFNTGFIACRSETYHNIFNKFQILWDEFDLAFAHYAKIQLCICAAVHKLNIKWIQTPGHLCSHGHWGMQPWKNVVLGTPPTFNGRIIALDHRLTF